MNIHMNTLLCPNNYASAKDYGRLKEAHRRIFVGVPLSYGSYNNTKNNPEDHKRVIVSRSYSESRIVYHCFTSFLKSAGIQIAHGIPFKKSVSASILKSLGEKSLFFGDLRTNSLPLSFVVGLGLFKELSLSHSEAINLNTSISHRDSREASHNGNSYKDLYEYYFSYHLYIKKPHLDKSKLNYAHTQISKSISYNKDNHNSYRLLDLALSGLKYVNIRLLGNWFVDINRIRYSKLSLICTYWIGTNMFFASRAFFSVSTDVYLEHSLSRDQDRLLIDVPRYSILPSLTPSRASNLNSFVSLMYMVSSLRANNGIRTRISRTTI